MFRRTLLPLLAVAMLLAPSCHRTDKAEQLAALESAYQSGLLTRDEYNAKKLALTGAAPAAAPAPVPAPVAPPPEPAPAPAAPPAEAAPPAASARVTVKVERPAPVKAQAPKVVPPPVQQLPTPAAPPPPPPETHEPAPAPAPLAGCEDAEFKSGGQKGAQERVFAAPPEVVKRAAVSALTSLDFNVHKNANNEIEASRKRHIGVIVGAGGERVILTFEKTSRGTRVVGETRKSFVGRMVQKTWTSAVLAQMACKLRESSR